MRHPHEAFGERPILLRPLILTGTRQRADGRAVIIAVAEQDLVLLALVMTCRDLAHHFIDLLIRLRARIRIIDAAQAGHLGQQLFGEQRRRNRAAGTRPVVQLDQLIAHHIGDAFAAVADVDRPDAARDAIKEFLALGIPQPHALAFDEDAGIDGFILLVLAEVVPDVLAIGFDRMAHVVRGKGKCHCASPERFDPSGAPDGGAAIVPDFHI